jgi:hypothetical protein
VATQRSQGEHAKHHQFIHQRAASFVFRKPAGSKRSLDFGAHASPFPDENIRRGRGQIRSSNKRGNSQSWLATCALETALAPRRSHRKRHVRFTSNSGHHRRPAAETQPRRAALIAATAIFFIHHRIKRALCFIVAGRHRVGQHTRRDLPRHTRLVFAPTTRALLAAVAHDGVPIAVGLGLIISGDLEPEGFVR